MKWAYGIEDVNVGVDSEKEHPSRYTRLKQGTKCAYDLKVKIQIIKWSQNCITFDQKESDLNHVLSLQHSSC